MKPTPGQDMDGNVEPKAPTLRDLAAKLDVSSATVSMALRNDPSISLATRERVQALARKMNYRSNILVSALLSQVRQRRRINSKGEVIGVLTEGDGFHHASIVASRWEIMQQKAQQIGLKLELFPLGAKGRDSASVGRVLFNRGIIGLILAPMPTNLVPVEIDWQRHAMVAVGYSFRQIAMHRVANAHFNGIMECYHHLTKAGYQRIGCILTQDDDWRAWHYWQAGALCAPRIYGGAKIEPLMVHGEDEQLFIDWFKQNQLDAVIGNQPNVAVDWLNNLGLKIPHDVCYACLDMADTSPFPGIRQSWNEIFTTAIIQLASELARNEFGLPLDPKVTLVDGKWANASAA